MKKWKIYLAWLFLTSSGVLFLLGFSQRQYTNQLERPYKIGVVIYRGDDQFISGLSMDMEKEIRKLEECFEGKIILKIVDSKNSQATQNIQVDDFIRSGYDAIVVNMVDRTVASGIINKAKQANIPVIFFNREPVRNDLLQWDKAFYVGSSAKESGQMEGQIVVDAYLETPELFDKNQDGKIQYTMLEGEEVHQDSLIRSETSINQIVSSQIEVQRLARAVGDWMRPNAFELTKKWMDIFGDEIELIISNNDEMALGAIQAYQESNQKIPPIVGIDGTKEAISAVDDGKLLGTVMNDNVTQAYAILDIAYRSGKNLPLDEVIPSLDGPYAWIPYKIYRQ
ncbi:galactose ABC transporter substrate-binding protein [Jeotgalibaca sp. MA1X17-3]|uniref:galactose ABC transporter substrate-binding protein n=1 Tax=Jeotgalibaca sp. MA1X17-3 TaxID=2908211 RepID=UPI001F2EE066|nr:galactose ABC transporter substrate-binding protein [Jeotgalibaca sp. MA1X17-3]UJF16316.1 galactose ABC transporter substrate-binding protein [Jeotgalibaca sp. MA1X17-3]